MDISNACVKKKIGILKNKVIYLMYSALETWRKFNWKNKKTI